MRSGQSTLDNALDIVRRLKPRDRLKLLDEILRSSVPDHLAPQDLPWNKHGPWKLGRWSREDLYDRHAD